MGKVFQCHKISEGRAEAEAVVSKDNIMFYLIDPATGKVIEKAHDLEGKSVSHKVLIFPGGKGSSVVQADGLYQLNQKKNSPAACTTELPLPPGKINTLWATDFPSRSWAFSITFRVAGSMR